MYLLIAAIIIAYIFELMFPQFMLSWFSLDPHHPFQIWRYVTNIFLHSPTDITHIGFNLLTLVMFAPLIYGKVGKKDFYTLFFVGGIVASITYVAAALLGIIPMEPAIGASGAIFAVLGACAVMYPDLIVFTGFFPLPMKYAVVFWVVTEFVLSFGPSNIAHMAHLGGLLFGLYYGKKLKEKYVRPKQPSFTVYFQHQGGDSFGY